MASSSDQHAAVTHVGICLENPTVRRLLLQAASALSLHADVIRPSAIEQWQAAHPGSHVVLDKAAAQAGSASAQAKPLDTRSWVFVVPSEASRADPGAHPQRRALEHEVAAPVDLPSASTLLRTLHTSAPVQADPTRSSGDIDQGDPAFDLAGQVATLPVDILLTGETGAGKDCLARFIHAKATPRGPFVAVNCSAIPETLAEAELFGHEAGAFTGALKARAGRVADANGGVLYLDEVDSCPLWLQAKLLRCLQDKGAPRVGSSEVRLSDFRLIASTKVPLQQLVSEERFRSDLYYRLKVVEINLLPIRHQHDRLLRVFERMTLESAIRFGRTPPIMTSALQAFLLSHPWPGNLRELRAAATRHALGLPLGDPPATPGDRVRGFRATVDAFEKGLLEASLKRWGGNVAKASAELGLPVNSLHYRLKRLNIDAHHVTKNVAAGSLPSSAPEALS